MKKRNLLYTIAPTLPPNALPHEADFGELFNFMLNWFLGLVGLIAVVMLIYGGFRFLTSGGNEESVDKAKKTIIYAIIGIIVIILSYAIVYTITTAFSPHNV